MDKKTKKGIFFAVLAACISGVSIFYNKLIIVRGIDPLVFNILKNGGVAVILSFFLLSTYRKNKLPKLSVNTWKKLFFIGLVGGSIPFVLYFEGLKSVSAINANLIQKSLFLWVAAAAIPILGEKISTLQTLGFLLVAGSNFFIGGFTGFKFSGGELMILLATLFWTAEVITAKITLKNTGSEIVAWGRMFWGSLILIAIAASLGKLPLIFQILPNQLPAISGSVILLLGYVSFWFKALKYAPANVATSILILATPLTNLLSSIFISHSSPVFIFPNFALSILGIIIIAFFIKKPNKHLTISPLK